MKTIRDISLIAVTLTVAAGCAATPATPAPSVAPPATAAAAVPTPQASFLEYAWPGDLAPGTYRTSFIWDSPVTVTLTVPEGWESRDVEVMSDRRSVMFALVDNVYSVPCQRTLSDPAIGGGVDDLADALAGLAGTSASVPEPVTFAEFDGKYLELSVGADAGCDPSEFALWTTKAEWMKPGHNGGTIFSAEHERYRIWVLDIAGTRYLVAALSAPDATPAELAELQGVVDSIKLSSGKG